MNKKLYELEELKELSTQIRRDIIRMVYNASSGHPGGSLGCVEYFVNLYFRIMEFNDTFRMDGKGEDIFILSNGHISPVLYSTLARKGFFLLNELNGFRKIGKKLQGHPTTHDGLEGIRISTGSLGQGLSVAIGMALAKKLNLDNRLVYVLLGDGEIQEGQIWEAAMFAAHHKVDQLIATIDLNYKQIDGDTRSVLNTSSLEDKWRSFNWEVLNINNGNDLEEVYNKLKIAKTKTGQKKPIMILMNTKMGYGIDYMTDNHEWHGKAPNTVEFNMAMNQLKETRLNDF